jgi:hypothetical protein
MAIFGNFKGTTTSEFKIGKKASGSKISTGTRPSSDLSNGDIYFDSANATLDIYESSWKNIGETLTKLNVDDGTLFVDSTNDTVSIGSTASNERLFVNGNLRLGTNPSLQFSGSALDLRHSNGTATQVRIRDNSSSSDPIFKVYDADNTNEVFKVQGNEVLYADNVKAKFGTGGDLEIYHDGSNSYIDDAGTGSLKLRSGTFTVSNATGSKTSAIFNSGGAQDLYHDNNKKFETTNSGISVTGDITLTGNITGADTDNLSEGTTNVYYTTARANSAIDAKLTGSLAFGDITTQTLKTGVVQGVLFEPISDYGSITDTANMVISFGTVEESATVGDFEYIKDTFGPTSDSYVVANLPDSSVAGQMIYVSDETGGAVMAFSDGSNWRRITDRAIVS